MTIRTSKFGFPLNEPSRNRSRSERTAFTPTFGLHKGRRPETLPPGVAADVQDMTVRDGALQPRDGIRRLSESINTQSSSLFDDTGLGNEPILGATDIFTSEGTAHIFALSARTLGALYGPASSWTQVPFSTRPSADSREQYWDITTAFDDDRSENIAVFTNAVDLPSFIQTTEGEGTVSDFTNAASLLSTANAVTLADNRLIWGGVEDGGVKRMDRVVWSARGQVQDYSNVGRNAGFEDLVDMEGTIRKFVRLGESAFLIFSELEIWRAEARRDNFAFDFFPIQQQFGCPFSNTIAKTPGGAIFLGADLELYAVSGRNVQPIGPAAEGDASRIRRLLQDEAVELERAFGVYRIKERQYELYYSISEDTYPERVLVFDLETRTFWKYTLPTEISYGVDAVLPATTGLGGQQLGGSLEDFRRTIYSSNATAYEFSGTSIFGAPSGTDLDSDVSIDSHWRSGVVAGGTDYKFVSGVEVEYTSDSASSLTVKGSVDGFVSNADTQTVSLNSSDRSVAWIPMRFSGRDPQIQVETSEGNTVKFHRFYVRYNRGGQF